jgi:thiamine transport system ATP-binding protein
MIEFRHGQYRSENFELSIALKIESRTFTAVLGPSGAGKSTLLSIISGFEDLSAGQLLLDGKDAASRAAADRPVNMIFQDHNSFAHLSVWNNVALGISPSLNLNATQKQQVQQALDKTGIAHLANRNSLELSGGEKQRIAIARVLVRNKPILLLDEPFAALDPGLRTEMLALVTSLQAERNLTVLLVTHQPEEAKRAADHVVFVNAGKAHPPIPTNQFFKSNDADILCYLGS